MLVIQSQMLFVAMLCFEGMTLQDLTYKRLEKYGRVLSTVATDEQMLTCRQLDPARQGQTWNMTFR